MAVIQFNGNSDIEVVKIQPYTSEAISQEGSITEIKSVKVDTFGVKT